MTSHDGVYESLKLLLLLTNGLAIQLKQPQHIQKRLEEQFLIGKNRPASASKNS